MSIETQILALMDDPKSKDKGFRLLMQTYQRDIYWHIRTIVSGHEDADDVIQNTFVKVFRHFEKFKREASLYTWIYRIATNEALTHLRKQARNRSVDLEIEHLAQQSDEGGPDGDEVLQRLHRAVGELPEKQKQVFNLRYFEEMSYGEMSEKLNTSVGALKASYHFAVKKIESDLRN